MKFMRFSLELGILTALLMIGAFTNAAAPARPGIPGGPLPPLELQRIRVLLSQNLGALGFSERYGFEEVILEPRGEPLVIYGGPVWSELEYRLAVLPGDRIKFGFQDGQIVAVYRGKTTALSQVVEARPLLAEREGRLTTALFSRGDPKKPPLYPGRFRMSLQEGGIYVVNDVDLEAYLERVVVSEMPPAFHPESLKVQAVAARTYALSRILAAPEENQWKALGADLDDSVQEQVYNQTSPDPRTTTAVRATVGEVVLYKGIPIKTNYSSTLPGYSANVQEVWPEREAVPYLVARPQAKQPLPEPNSEAAALKFFKDWQGEGFYDQASSLFRWKVKFTVAELEAILSRTLPERFKAEPEFSHTLAGISPAEPGFELGQLQKLEVTSRGGGGYVTGLDVVTSTGHWRFSRESQARFVLRPTSKYSGGQPIVLERFNGTKTEDFSSLPSAAFALEPEYGPEGSLQSITVWGGGFGHGVGMSQFGADGMGKAGYNYREILAHFYPGTQIANLEALQP